MKKVLITSLCALFLNINCLKAQTQNNDCNKKSAAVAEQVNGIYIFTDSKPVKEYDFLGTVQATGAFSVRSPQYESVRDVLIKRLKKEYPQADGIILKLKDGDTDKADAIKFKE